MRSRAAALPLPRGGVDAELARSGAEDQPAAARVDARAAAARRGRTPGGVGVVGVDQRVQSVDHRRHRSPVTGLCLARHERRDDRGIARRRTFDEAADHGLADPECRAAWRSLLLEHLPAAPARIADLGCGTGTLALLLADEGYAVNGVDFSPEMVRRARAKAGHVATFHEADAAAPPLDAGGVRRRAEPARAVGDALPRCRARPMDPAAAARRPAACSWRAAGRPALA